MLAVLVNTLLMMRISAESIERPCVSKAPILEQCSLLQHKKLQRPRKTFLENSMVIRQQEHFFLLFSRFPSLSLFVFNFGKARISPTTTLPPIRYQIDARAGRPRRFTRSNLATQQHSGTNEQRWSRPTAHRSWLPGCRSSSTRCHGRRPTSTPRRPRGASTTAASTSPSRRSGGTHVSSEVGNKFKPESRHDRLNWHLRWCNPIRNQCPGLTDGRGTERITGVGTKILVSILS